jgi:hypothetical protein
MSARIEVRDLERSTANYALLNTYVFLAKEAAERHLQQLCHLAGLGDEERPVREIGDIGVYTEIAWRDVERGKGAENPHFVTA